MPFWPRRMMHFKFLEMKCFGVLSVVVFIDDVTFDHNSGRYTVHGAGL